MEHTSSYESAPLVVTSAGEAAETMISEGGPVSEPFPDLTLGQETLRQCRIYKRRVAHQVDAHPFYSVGIALGFGIMLGLLTER